MLNEVYTSQGGMYKKNGSRYAWNVQLLSLVGFNKIYFAYNKWVNVWKEQLNILLSQKENGAKVGEQIAFVKT